MTECVKKLLEKAKETREVVAMENMQCLTEEEKLLCVISQLDILLNFIDENEIELTYLK